MHNLIGAVIVTYHPDIVQLQQLIERVQPQVETVVLVDNTPGINQPWHALVKQSFSVELIPKIRNSGIAAAQNDGIRYLQQRACQFVLFLDQDSLPDIDMVSKLMIAYCNIAQMKLQIGGIGPRSFISKINQEIPFIKQDRLDYANRSHNSEIKLVPVTYLISSGTLVPIANFEVIGLMREDLFIDYVDIEWCLRAQHHGYQLFGVYEAKMQHDLGDEPMQVFGRIFFTHNPLRHYYLIRNAIAMYKLPNIKLSWKIKDAFKLSIKVMIYCIFCHPRWQHVKMMCYGFKDGIQNRLGEAPVFIKP